MKRHTLQAATAILLLAVMAAPILATEMPTEPTAPGQRGEQRQDGQRLSAEQRAEHREQMRAMNREERREQMHAMNREERREFMQQQRSEARQMEREQRQ